ncbi:hypothetical protein EUA76_00010 [TM7 phylum sp. oral taxon 350]|nr:hypothetical protein EUA76_00010 [TM7 phylum sp. oral taxon 350]
MTKKSENNAEIEVKEKAKKTTKEDGKAKALDLELLKDPEGKKINEKDSSFKYEPTNCDNEKCKSYLLSTTMKKEADYQVKSKH